MGNTTVRLCMALAVCCVFGSCGDGASRNATSSFGGKQPPRKRSLLGNWTIDVVRVVSDFGRHHRVRRGQPLRIANNGVQVVAGQSVSDRSAIRFMLERIFGGEFERSETINETGFELEFVLDYSPAFFFPKRSVFDRLLCRGHIAGQVLLVDFLYQSILPDRFGRKREIDRDELVLTCIKGPSVGTVRGDWRIVATELLDSRRDMPAPQRGERLGISQREVTGAFTEPFTAEGFTRLHPDFAVVERETSAFDGIVQGLLFARGKPGTRHAGEGRLFVIDMALSGERLRGWYLASRQGRGADAFVELLIDLERATSKSSVPSGGTPPGFLRLKSPREIESLRRRFAPIGLRRESDK